MDGIQRTGPKYAGQKNKLTFYLCLPFAPTLALVPFGCMFSTKKSRHFHPGRTYEDCRLGWHFSQAANQCLIDSEPWKYHKSSSLTITGPKAILNLSFSGGPVCSGEVPSGPGSRRYGIFWI